MKLSASAKREEMDGSGYVSCQLVNQLLRIYIYTTTYVVFTRDTFTSGKCHVTIENVTQYNRNVNLPQVNVSRVNTAIGYAVFVNYNE